MIFMNLRPAIATASFCFLPWSLPVWALAAVLYKLSGGAKADGNGALGLLVGIAPALLPIYVYDRTLARILER